MWRALVQVRQKVDHKRTFLYLEQLILKHNADRDTVAIKEAKDGIDFYYATKQHAVKMVDFLNVVMPARTKASDKLVSADEKNATANQKFTYSIELVPICKDDLVCLPAKLARSLANISQLLLCTRVSNSVHLVDPLTLRHVDLYGHVYWRDPFPPLASVARCVEFVVLDIEEIATPHGKGRMTLADAQVAPVSSSMASDAIFYTRTHLGSVLKPGDTVLGYLVGASNFNNDAFDSLDPDRIPEVVLVRKTYPNRRKKSRPRNWKLRSIAKETGDGEHAGLGRMAGGGHEAKEGRGRRGEGADAARQAEVEYELFLRDLEEDKELRSTIQVFKSEPRSNGLPTTSGTERRRIKENAMEVVEAGPSGEEDDVEMDSGTEAEDEDDDDFPEIQVDELLDEMDALKIRDEALASSGTAAHDEDD